VLKEPVHFLAMLMYPPGPDLAGGRPGACRGPA